MRVWQSLVPGRSRDRSDVCASSKGGAQEPTRRWYGWEGFARGQTCVACCESDWTRAVRCELLSVAVEKRRQAGFDGGSGGRAIAALASRSRRSGKRSSNVNGVVLSSLAQDDRCGCYPAALVCVSTSCVATRDHLVRVFWARFARVAAAPSMTCHTHLSAARSSLIRTPAPLFSPDAWRSHHQRTAG